MSKLHLSQFQKINALLKNAKNILIVSHEDPDADAIGSMLGLNLFLKEIGLKPFLYLSDSPPNFFSFLPGFSEIKNKIPKDLDFDLLFGLDYGDFKRLNLPGYVLAKKSLIKNLITIDHHQGRQTGKVKIVDPKVSSTCEIIYQWLKEAPPAGSLPIDIIDKEIATCLLTGIVGDTGGFSHVSTSFRTMRAASDLLSKGAPLDRIENLTLFSESTSLLKSAEIFGKVLSRIKTVPECKLVYSWLSTEDLRNQPFSTLELNEILGEGRVASIISKELNCNFALFLIEYKKGEIRGCLRSEPFKGKKVDQIAKKLGGGGHPYAAGFKQRGTIEEVLKKVLDLVE